MNDLKLPSLLVVLLAAGCPSSDDGDATTSSTTNDDGTTAATTDAITTGQDTAPAETSAAQTSAAETTAADGGSTSEGSGTAAGSEGGSAGESTTGAVTGAPITFAWTEVVITPACFLFYDPSILGSEAVWTDDGGAITLVFDGNPAPVFSGSFTGDALTLVAENDNDYNGDIWKTTQTIEATLADGTLSGTWSYSECDSTNAPESCPADGGCTGVASFTAVVP